MQKESQNLNFEKAAQLRDRIRAIKSVSEKQIASSATDKCYDVFALARDELGTLAYGLFVRGGNVISAEGYKIEAEDESFSEIIEQFLLQFYHDAGDMPHEINVADEPQECEQLEAFLSQKCGHSVKIRVPKRGEKLKQCELAKMNAAQTLARSRELAHREWERTEGALAELCRIIGIGMLPHRMECFDNSHFQGRDTVGSMVVSSTENRKKACTAALKQSRTRPGTIILLCVNIFRDGSNERLRVTKSLPSCRICWLWTAAGDSSMLRLRFWTNMDCHISPAIGLAEKNEEIILPDREEPVILPRSSPALQILQRIRDEAHRFAITYHRSVRAKNSLYSRLDEIEGIGDKRKRVLYEKFVTIDAVSAAGIDELRAVPGMNIRAAQAVYDFFHPNGSAGAAASARKRGNAVHRNITKRATGSGE